jgi:PhnB protein
MRESPSLWDNVRQQELKSAKEEPPMSNESQAANDPKTTLSPMLSVRDGAKAVEFYKAAFGAGELFRIEAPDGAVVAQLSVGESEFWLADESPEHGNFSPESLSAEFRGGATVRMVMVVADPDAVFARAVKAGAAVVSPVEDKEYGWRVGRVVDPFGHHWEIGKPLASVLEVGDLESKAPPSPKNGEGRGTR